MSRKHRYGRGGNGIIAAALLAAGVWTGAALAKGAYRYRWQLTPAFVAGSLLPLGWIAALTFWLWPAWTLAAFAVGAGCAAMWVWQGLQRRYDRILGAVVSAVCLAWLLAVAVEPGAGALYGVLLLGWPVLGIFWWCGGAFRSGRAMAHLRKRWDTIANLAGIAGAKLVRAENTDVGEVLTVELPGDKTQRDVSRTRVEAAMNTRPGGVHLVNDDKRARRVTIHHVVKDPWADGSEVAHPLMAVVAAMAAADATSTDLGEAA
jgi:hypothetical protein